MGDEGNQPEWERAQGRMVKEDDLGQSPMTQIFENTVMRCITLCVNYYFKKIRR